MNIDKDIIEYKLFCTWHNRVAKDITEHSACLYDFDWKIYKVKYENNDDFYRVVLKVNDKEVLDNTYPTLQAWQEFVFGYITAYKHLNVKDFIL